MKGVQMRAAGEGAVLTLMGDVGYEITAKGVADALKGAGKGPLTVSLHSYGGDALAGVAIHNMIARHPGMKTVIVEGVAASAASLIAMAGDRIVMPDNALLMIHEAWGLAMGDSEDMRKQADVLDTVSGAYRRTYAARTGKDEDEIAALMAAETWFTAADAVAQGFATEMSAPVEVRAMALSEGRFSRAPAALAAFVHNPPAVPVPQEVVSMTESTPQAAAQAVTDQAVPAGPVPATLAQIKDVAARAKLGADWVLAQAEAAAPLDVVRDAAIDAVAAKANVQPIQGAAVRVGESHDDPAKVLDAIATAIAARAMPEARKAAKDDRWKQYASLRPSEMLIEMAAARGERVTHRDRDRLIRAAFHTTSDFPLLLENAGNKMLEAGYAAAEPSYRMFFAQRAFNDFKAHSFLTAGDFPALAELAEGAEITSGTISEKRERITAKTYARALPVTRQMLVNDDLGAFAEFGTMIGRRVADYENALAYALVGTASGDGPTLTEGNAAVFGTGAGRNNKSSGSTAVNATALGLGFNAMAAQTSLDGIKLNITPRYLVCSLIQQFVALQFATSITDPQSAANVNVFGGRFQVVADANITNNRWYLFADPSAAPVYVYGYVNGATAPQVRVFDPVQGRDAMVVEVVHDFAVGAIDYRGGYFNPGAAPP
jgi:ATP-dependent protease ClpP protease subunit